MSVAFAIEVARSASEARWRAAALAIPAAGLGLATIQLSAGSTFLLDASPGAASAAALICAAGAIATAAAAFVALRGARRGAHRPAPTAVPAAAAPSAGVAGAPPALVVDEAGTPGLRQGSDASARPMSLRAWCMLPGLTVLVLAPYPPQPAAGRRTRPVTLVLGRDAASDEAWRRLHVWLRWNERGRTDRQTLGPHRP